MTITLGNDKKGAIFSLCGKYRYALWREIEDPPLLNGVPESLAPRGDLVFIGLNPSTADEISLDITTTICRNYTRAWGHKRYVMLNIFGWIDTDPAGMKRATEPIGPDNAKTLRDFCRNARTIICCWGTDGAFRNRQKFVLEELLNEFDLYVLTLTKGGFPHHPTRLATQEKPTLWRSKS